MFFKGYIKIRGMAAPIRKELDFSVNCEKCREKTRATPGRSLVKNKKNNFVIKMSYLPEFYGLVETHWIPECSKQAWIQSGPWLGQRRV